MAVRRNEVHWSDVDEPINMLLSEKSKSHTHVTLPSQLHACGPAHGPALGYMAIRCPSHGSEFLSPAVHIGHSLAKSVLGSIY